MKRKLLLTNLALLVLSGAVTWHLRQEWKAAAVREQTVLRRRLKPAPAPPMTPLRTLEPVKAAGYIDIAQKMLFSKDRNPTVVIEPPPPPKPKPMPALPLFHGMLDLGDGPVAIMSENARAPHHDYQPGDKVGAFKLVDVSNDAIVLEWEGQTITKSPEEMLDRDTPAPGTVAGNVAAKAPPTAAPAVKITPPEKPGPGLDLGGGVRACQPGETSAAGAVVDGMRKVIKTSPFGSKCYWEPAGGSGAN
ncbi:MAG TPA: hypothetical protein VMI94_24100 [Bryobacteraceae bacterium]|nr:hypothetical protein [Bryobacteraceae bacterium]